MTGGSRSAEMESEVKMSAKTAYFSMEIALAPGMPTYSGGLGVLAGDTIRAAADLGVPLTAVTLLYRKGYFSQRLDASGWQREEPAEWVAAEFLTELAERASVTIEHRTVYIRAWRYDVKAPNGWTAPVYLLDTDVPENAEWDRALTHHLYGGDEHYRLCQEVVLGIGGVRMLRALGHQSIARFHLNEGHAALLTMELLDESARAAGRTSFSHDDVDSVRRHCVFTTHTPVPAGHDKFSVELAMRVLGRKEILEMRDIFFYDGVLNMTYLALNLSDYVNGVAKKHAEVSRLMFAEYQIDAITNGVHVPTWTSAPFSALFDRYIPGWREDSFSLRYAFGIPPEDIWQAHSEAKHRLVEYVNRETNAGLQHDLLTIGFARRATAYKRAELLLNDIERLRTITGGGGLQVVYAGKAHPRDHEGKEQIKRIFQARHALKNHVAIVYLPDYEWKLGALMTAGVDVWLNTPQPPKEASGTSGMKAALNGVPSLSILDGWWIEGCIEGKTGWAIDPGPADSDTRTSDDAAALYDKLEKVIIPLYYENRKGFIDVMTHAIALNGSFFNTHRMVLEYVLKAYSRHESRRL
jgi:glycogen phosphorylase